MKKICAFMLVLALSLVCSSSINVFAAQATTPEEYYGAMIKKGGCAKEGGNGTTYNSYHAVVKSNAKFATEAGGYKTWGDLVNSNGEVTELSFNNLTSSAQQKFLTYYLEILNNEVMYFDKNGETATGNTVVNLTTKNAQAFYQARIIDELGVGSAVVASIMGGINPDFVKANKVLSPFLSVINTLMGVLGVLLMAFLGLTLLLDLAYMALPVFRNLLLNEGKERNGGTVRLGQLVSDEAVQAVKMSTEHNEQSPFVIYLRKKWLALLFFMILLVALVSGRLFNVIGSIVDLVNGFFD